MLGSKRQDIFEQNKTEAITCTYPRGLSCSKTTATGAPTTVTIAFVTQPFAVKATPHREHVVAHLPKRSCVWWTTSV